MLASERREDRPKTCPEVGNFFKFLNFKVMFKLKFVLPMLAFVLAIGMSFAFTSEAPGDLVIEIDGQLYESPINCPGDGLNCIAKISKDGEELEVQVLREMPDGSYAPEMTSSPNLNVYPFSSLQPVNP